MPRNLQAKLATFFKHHPLLASALSGNSYYHTLPGTDHAPFSTNFSKPTAADKKFLAHMKKSLSRTQQKTVKHGNRNLYKNLIIKVDDHWLIKASALFNRRANILSEMGLHNRNATLPHAKLKEFTSAKGGRTYQTISRMAYWLRAKQAQKELHLNRIYLPLKYLMHIPGRPTDLDDTNYFVVAKQIPNAKPITQTDLLGDEKVVTELTQATCSASLWNLTPGNVVTAGGKVYIVDLEQPNNCPPSQFGRGGINGCGIETLKKMIQDHGAKNSIDVSNLTELVTAIAASLEK